MASSRFRANRATPRSLLLAPSASLARPSGVRTSSAAAMRVSACSATSARSTSELSSRSAAMAIRRRSASCVRRGATSRRIASLHASACRCALADSPSCVSASNGPSTTVRTDRTLESVSVFSAVASASRFAQRRAAAARTSAAGSDARRSASSPESGGSSETPSTRCAGSGCSCNVERKRRLMTMVIVRRDQPMTGTGVAGDVMLPKKAEGVGRSRRRPTFRRFRPRSVRRRGAAMDGRELAIDTDTARRRRGGMRVKLTKLAARRGTPGSATVTPVERSHTG